MGVQVTKAQVFKAMRDHSLCYWHLFDGKNLIDECQQEDIDQELSIQNLDEVLSNCSGQNVLVKLSDYTNETKGRVGSRKAKNIEYVVRLPMLAAAGNGMDSGSMSLLKEIFNLKVEQVKDKYEHQLEELRREIREAKEEKQNPYLEQAIGHLAGMFTNTAPVASNLAGMPQPEPVTAPVNDVNIKRMRIALNKIGKVDPDITHTLEMIAELATKHPEKYKSFIPLIQSQI